MAVRANQSFVIIESASGTTDNIRSSLIKAGATVHIFEHFAAALLLIGRKKVDGVVVAFDHAKATEDFCAAVRRLKVPIVFSTPNAMENDRRRFGFEVNFSRRRETPTLFLPYPSRLIRAKAPSTVR